MTRDLKQEVIDLLDLVHDLIDSGKEGPHNCRLTLSLPEGWHVLAAWLQLRELWQRSGGHGPSPVRVLQLDSRVFRAFSKTYIGWVLNEHFQRQLHDLAKGGHRFLKPPTVTVTKSVKGGES